MDPGEATLLLQRLAAGDRAAGEALLGLLYGELRSVAARCMSDERGDHTLQPTALVHEAWMRISAGGAPPRFEDRGHFVRLCARAMRNVLVDHARARNAQKRGQGQRPQPLDGVVAAFEEQRLDVLALHAALERLQALDEPLARLVELRFFAGLSIAEASQVLGRSPASLERDWRVARLWLRRELPA